MARSPDRPSARFFAIAGAVVLGAGLTGVAVGRLLPPAASVTASPASTPFSLIPPRQVGEFVRQPGASPEVKIDAGQQTSWATYSRDGKAVFILLLSRPAPSVEQFLATNAITDIRVTGDATCGRSKDAASDACAIVVDKTALLVVDLAGQTREALADAVSQAADVVRR